MSHMLAYHDYREDGIFGTFYFEGEEEPFCVTLSHAYEKADGTFYPVVGPGHYTCVKGLHALENGVPFVTFEITGIPGHSGLLFHAGNWNKDSKGCTLLGKAIVDSPQGKMVTSSKNTFAAWCKRLADVQSFELDVVDATV